MSNQLENTVFHYLYRDAANYKSPGSVVFRGGFDAEMEKRIRGACHSGEHFVAEQVGLPLLFGFLDSNSSVDPRYDHGWHEFTSADVTARLPNDREGRSFEEFICTVEEQAQQGWDVRSPAEIIAKFS
jgi:hypothetical protein